MKKKLWIVVLSLMMLLALVFGVADCKKKKTVPQISTPVVSISEDGLAKWKVIINASGYVYKLDDGKEIEVQATVVRLMNGQTITVKALAIYGYADSEYSTPQTYTAGLDITCEHSYGEPAWSWTENDADEYSANAFFTCANCGYKQSMPAEVTSSIEKEAECAEDGKKVYIAEVTFEDKIYNDTKNIAIPKIGHDLQSVSKKEATCTSSGNEAYSICSRCDYREGYQETPAMGHTYALTCWEWEDEDFPYTAQAVFTCRRSDGHTIKITATISSKEEQIGCDLCTVYTATVNVDFGEGTYTDQKTVANGTGTHLFGDWHELVPATCVSVGMKGYKQCTKCALYFDAKGNKIADNEDELILSIDPKAHKILTKIEGEPATCEDEGYEQYWHCDDCEKMYADRDGEEFIDSPKIIEPLGHDYKFSGEPDVYPTDESTGSATVRCTHVGCNTATKTVTLPVLTDKNYGLDAEVDCERGSMYMYSIVIDGMEIVFIIETEALGHISGEWVYLEDGHWQLCERCGEEIDLDEHEWSDWEVDSNDSSKHIRATICPEHTEHQYSESMAHDYEVGICKHCNYKHVHGTLSPGHNATHHWGECLVCGYKTSEIAHEYEDGFCSCGVMDSDYSEITATYDASQKGYSNQFTLTYGVEKNITITFEKGSSGNEPKYFTDSSSIRAYGGNTITISAPNGYFIKEIKFTLPTGGSNNGNDITADKSGFNGSVWTGLEQIVKFTVSGTSGHRRISVIEVVYIAPEAWGEHTKLNKVEGKAATCTDTGTEDYWECGNCGKWFSDKLATTEIFEEVVTDALGHEYGEWHEEDDLHHSGNCTICRNSTTIESHNLEGEDGACSKCGYVNKLTSAQRADAALNALIIPSTLERDYVLSVVEGVTFTVASNNDAIKQEGNTLKVTRGAENISVQLTVKATCDDYITPNPQTFNVTVPAKVVSEKDVTLDFHFSKIGSNGWSSSYNSRTVIFDEEGVTVIMSNASAQTGTITDIPVLAAKNNTTYATVELTSGSVKEVEFVLRQWATKTFNKIYIEYYDGSAWKTCSDSIAIPAKLTSTVLTGAITKVRLAISTTTSSNVQVGLEAINLKVTAAPMSSGIELDTTPDDDIHECVNVCDTCHKCKDENCRKDVCNEKCDCSSGGELFPQNASLSFSSKDARTTYTANSIQVWQNDGITFTNIGNNGDYAGPVRIYANTQVKVEFTSAMKEIVFHCNSTEYASNLESGLKSSGYTVSVNGKNVTVTFASATASIEFSVTKQVRLDSLDVKA